MDTVAVLLEGHQDRKLPTIALDTMDMDSCGAAINIMYIIAQLAARKM